MPKFIYRGSVQRRKSAGAAAGPRDSLSDSLARRIDTDRTHAIESHPFSIARERKITRIDGMTHARLRRLETECGRSSLAIPQNAEIARVRDDVGRSLPLAVLSRDTREEREERIGEEDPGSACFHAIVRRGIDIASRGRKADDAVHAADRAIDIDRRLKPSCSGGRG